MDRRRDAGPPERINSAFVVDTGPIVGANDCFQYMRTGKCDKGDTCRFSHGTSSVRCARNVCHVLLWVAALATPARVAT